MNKIHRLFFVLGVALCVHSASAAGVRVGDVGAAVLPTPSLMPSSGSYGEGTRHGYVEFRLQLTNTSPQERVVHLSYPPRESGMTDFGVLVTRTVKIAGKQTVSVSLYQPPQNVAGSGLEVRVEGVKDPAIISVSSPFSNRYSYNESPRVAVLLGRGVPQEFRDGMREESASGSKPKSSGGATPVPPYASGFVGPSSSAAEAPVEDRFTFLRSELPAREWSQNWLGYSCYDAIVLGGREVEEMPPQARLALRRWVECGGTLLINAKTVPEVFTEGGIKEAKPGLRVGLGRVLISRRDGKLGWTYTYKQLVDTHIPIYCPTDPPSNNDNLLVSQTTVPIRGLFVLVLLFGICIGPANLWLLSRYKRRIWLWWNVPAVSLVTCLTVFGYSLASEGWTIRGKTASLTVLDERFNRATTLGFLSFYSPLTPSSGPHFTTDTRRGPAELRGRAVAALQPSRVQHDSAGRLDGRSAFALRLGDGSGADLLPGSQERRPPRAAGRREERGRNAEGGQRPGGRHSPLVPGRSVGARLRGPRYSRRRRADAQGRRRRKPSPRTWTLWRNRYLWGPIGCKVSAA